MCEATRGKFHLPLKWQTLDSAEIIMFMLTQQVTDALLLLLAVSSHNQRKHMFIISTLVTHSSVSFTIG